VLLHLDVQTLCKLQSSKNLLAFSAGVDSTALFFLLTHYSIPFDIALVNYKTRSSSDEEEQYAKTLAKHYDKACFTTQAPLFEHNFEKAARDFRYQFFERIIEKHRYDNLLTAHQLNDQLEWFLMRLAKGAGLVELLGMQSITQRSNYKLVRPILHHSKEELLAFLQTHHHHYFVDQSNFDTHHERNHFRHLFSDPLLAEYREGVGRSFEYLKADQALIRNAFHERFRYKELVVIAYHQKEVIPRAVDHVLKSLGYLMSAAQRELLEEHNSIVLGGIWVVEVSSKRIYIAPYHATIMPKHYKELCRQAKLPKKIRPYCFEQGLLPYQLSSL